MAKTVEVEKPFGFLPAIAWAILLDVVDVAGNIVNVILAAAGIGFVTDVIVDVVQVVIGLAIFKDKSIPLINVGEIALPPALDAFPTYTAIVLYKQYVK